MPGVEAKRFAQPTASWTSRDFVNGEADVIAATFRAGNCKSLRRRFVRCQRAVSARRRTDGSDAIAVMRWLLRVQSVGCTHCRTASA